VDFGYARVSTYEQNLQLQLDALEKAGCDIVRTETASGKAESARPVQGAILREMKPGDTLTVWKLDRLGRSAVDLERLVTKLEKRGMKFRALTQNIDTSSSLGRFFFQLLAAFAELERAMIVERTKAGKQARIAQGLHPGGPRAYGLADDRKTVIEDEAARLREAAEHALSGGSLGRLAIDWNAAGVPTWSGKGRWRATSLRRMLLNPDLVSAVFDAHKHAALARLFAPARARQQLGAPVKHLGSGILKCECGGSMYAAVRPRLGAKVLDYRCHRSADGRERGCRKVSILADTADAWLAEAFVAAVLSERFTRALAARRATLLEGEATSEELDKWQAEISELETVLSTRFGTDQHQRRHDELQEKVKRAERRLLARPELQELMDIPRSEAGLRAAWDGWSVAERRKKLRLLLRSVKVKSIGRGSRGYDPGRRLVPDWKI
jgi:DNA invertase Pin-like site-specific DNA recombinase